MNKPVLKADILWKLAREMEVEHDIKIAPKSTAPMYNSFTKAVIKNVLANHEVALKDFGVFKLATKEGYIRKIFENETAKENDLTVLFNPSTSITERLKYFTDENARKYVNNSESIKLGRFDIISDMLNDYDTKTAENIYDGIMKIIIDEIEKGSTVKILNLGSFEPISRKDFTNKIIRRCASLKTGLVLTFIADNNLKINLKIKKESEKHEQT